MEQVQPRVEALYEGAGTDRPTQHRPSTLCSLEKRLLKISFKMVLLLRSFLGPVLVMEVRQHPGSCLKGSQRRCRAITAYACTAVKTSYPSPSSAGFGCLQLEHSDWPLLFLFSFTLSQNHPPLSPELFLSLWISLLSIDSVHAGLPGEGTHTFSGQWLPCAALAGAKPGGLVFEEQRIPVLWLVQPRSARRNSRQCRGGISPFILWHSLCVHCQQDGEHSLFYPGLGFPYLLLVCYH